MTAVGVKAFHPKRHLSLPVTWCLLFALNQGGKRVAGRLGWRADSKKEADMLGDDKEHEYEQRDIL